MLPGNQAPCEIASAIQERKGPVRSPTRTIPSKMEGQAMKQATPSELRHAVESQHGCKAGLLQTVMVKKTLGEKIWEGAVHIFDLSGHPDANQAYAWACAPAGGKRPQFFSVLRLPPVTSPDDAIELTMAGKSEEQ